MSLSNCQPRGIGIMALISPFLQLLTLREFRHRWCSYCPGHWGFLTEGLQVCSVVPYHHDAFLLPFLNSVYVFCTVRPWGTETSWVCRACTMTLILSPTYALPVFTGTIQEEKGSMVFTFWVYINWSLSFVSDFSYWPSPTSMGIILCTDRRCAALAFARGMAKASISTSLITLTPQPIVGIPRIRGTLATKLKKSRITRAKWSSS